MGGNPLQFLVQADQNVSRFPLRGNRRLNVPPESRRRQRKTAIARSEAGARSLAGLTQWELGRRLGVTYQQVQKYETGRDGVSVATMSRLRIILNCEFADLLAGLGRIPEPESVADAGPQRQARRMVRAMLAIGDAGVQEGLIKLAQLPAADRQGGRTGRRPGRPRKAGP
jgi:transcriptional regulator with XRE-family HTH domain